METESVDFNKFAERIESSLTSEVMVTELIQEYGTPAQLGEMYGALAAASGEFGQVVKSKTVSYGYGNGKVEYSYAPLASLVHAIQKPLSKQGVFVAQPLLMDGAGQAEQRTMVTHKGGGRLVMVARFAPNKDIKQLGGQSTYLARYCLCRLFLLDGMEDADDYEGDIPSGVGEKPKSKPEAPRKKPSARPAPKAKQGEEPRTDEQLATLKRLSQELQLTPPERAELCREVTGGPTDALTLTGANKLIERFQQMVLERQGED